MKMELCDYCEKRIDYYQTARIAMDIAGTSRGDWSDEYERVFCSKECAIDFLSGKVHTLKERQEKQSKKPKGDK